MFERWYTLTAPLAEYRSDDRVAISADNANATITAHGSWIGRVIVQLENAVGNGSGSALGDYQIPQPDGSRSVVANRLGGSGSRLSVRVDYSVNPGQQIVRALSHGSILAGFNTWVEIVPFRFTAPTNAAQFAMTFDVGWDNASFTPSYRMRIYNLTRGVQLALYDNYNIGPIFGGAYRQRSVTATSVVLNAGDVVVFEVNASISTESYRRVRDAQLRATYVQFA